MSEAGKKAKPVAGVKAKAMAGAGAVAGAGAERIYPADKTNAIERDVLTDRKPKFKYVLRIFAYVFSSAKMMSSIYLGVFLLLSLLRPVLAFIWSAYIREAEALPCTLPGALPGALPGVPQGAGAVLSTEAGAASGFGAALSMGIGAGLSTLPGVLPGVSQGGSQGWLGTLFGADILPALSLIAAYFFMNYIVGLLDRYVGLQGGEDIEQLSIVQDNRLRERLYAKIYKKLASLPTEHMEIAKINDNVEQTFTFIGGSWDDGINRGLMLKSYAVIAKAVSVLAIAASLYVFNPWLCLIALAAPLPSLYSTTLGQKLQFKFKKDNTKLERRLKYFQNLMLSPAAKELKVFGLHDHFYRKWKALADEYTLKEAAMIRTQTLVSLTNRTVSSLANIGGSIFAIVLMASGRISLGALGAVLALTGALVADAGALLTSISALLSKKNESAQFWDLMELPGHKPGGGRCGAIAAIEARGLKYRYPLTDTYVLEDINLTIKQGEKVAFVGENGAGKTTFIKLAAGTLSPSGGELLINGAHAEDIDTLSRYDAASAVVQDPSRYETFTIGDNVFLGDSARPRDESAIDAAIAFSGFDGADKDAPLGKDTGGTELSGGQWQKLAIARAAYRNRGFIVLDEPTSNLDPLAEAEIFKKYIDLAEDKTVIFVTHRVSAASLADRIVVFKGGRIVQDGAHAELSRGGEYARLYAEQAKWYNR